jgi:hypothetical protein
LSAIQKDSSEKPDPTKEGHAQKIKKILMKTMRENVLENFHEE